MQATKQKWNLHRAWFWRLRGFFRAFVHTLPAAVWCTRECSYLVLCFTTTSQFYLIPCFWITSWLAKVHILCQLASLTKWLWSSLMKATESKNGKKNNTHSQIQSNSIFLDAILKKTRTFIPVDYPYSGVARPDAPSQMTWLQGFRPGCHLFSFKRNKCV